MRKGFAKFLFLCVFALLCGAAPEAAPAGELSVGAIDPSAGTDSLDLQPIHAAVAGSTLKPVGWVDFCRRYKSECASPDKAAGTFRLDAKAWSTVEYVNNWVNENVAPVSDEDHWHLAERWDYPNDGKGDCEDYALLKRKLLIEDGIPRQALLMTVVKDENGNGHAVLMVRSDRGDFILDNKRPAVELWSKTGYVFIKRQSKDDPNVWLSFRNGDQPAVATSSYLKH